MAAFKLEIKIKCLLQCPCGTVDVSAAPRCTLASGISKMSTLFPAIYKYKILIDPKAGCRPTEGIKTSILLKLFRDLHFVSTRKIKLKTLSIEHS